MDATGIAVLIGAAVTLLTAIGGSIAWAAAKFKALQDKLAQVEADYSKVLWRSERTRAAFQLVASELQRKSPGNSALRWALAMLDDDFRIDPDLPRDAKEALAEIERAAKADA